MKEYKITSLTDFDTAIKNIIKEKSGQYQSSSFIFRGQCNKAWNIVSSAYRYMHSCFPSIIITNTVLEYFKECIQNDVDELTKIENGNLSLRNEDEVMCMLQHLGGKSLFIDFSKNGHVALFFACEKCQNTKDGVVFVMRNEGGRIFNDKGKEVGKYKHIKLDKNNPAFGRVRVQNSCFLRPYDDGIILNDNDIIKIIIDKNSKLRILEDLASTINHKVVYPDIFGYIGRQRANSRTCTLKSIVFRETAQLIKDGNVRRIEEVLETLRNLEELDGLDDNDYLRIKTLKIRALMCIQKFDEALMILNSIQERFWIFQKLNDINANQPTQFDPIEPLIVNDFEKAKCYMGKSEYEIANDFYIRASDTLNDIDDFVIEKHNLKREILKQQAISLVKQNKNNLSIALDLLSEISDDKNSLPDLAGIYMVAERWETAIDILRNCKDDYSLNLRANCYMELSKIGNKKMYLLKAITTYQEALKSINMNQRNKNVDYIPKTYDHDHHFKLAVAYEAMHEYEKAKDEYKSIMNSPYDNEVAMHNFVSLLYKIDKTDYKNIIKHYFAAIKNSRNERHPQNYNDIGRLLIDIYQTGKYPEEVRDILIEEINDLRNSEIYHENIKYELNMIMEHILNNNSDKSSVINLLLVAERLFIIADTLNRKDAFANKNIGDIYYIRYTQSSINERNRHEFAEKALTRYILAHSYYLIDKKRNNTIDDRISELEAYLKREILVFQE